MTDRHSAAVDTVVPSHHNLSTQYALHIAIQTMKERCQTLQQRLIMVEDENHKIRESSGVDKPEHQHLIAAVTTDNGLNNPNEMIELLREQVAELTRQKTQLTEHIAMVATENRQLWSRLSKMTKHNQELGDSLDKMKNSLSTSQSNNHLIRSKTFTQNSPNPALRQKNNVTSVAQNEDLSLEEISLKVLNEFLEGKAQVEKQYNEYIEGFAVNSIGFSYLNDVRTEVECQTDTKKCMDGMSDMKKELLRQQSDLKVAISRLRQRKVLELCSLCKNRSHKPKMADKNLETEDCLMKNNSYCDVKAVIPITSQMVRDDGKSTLLTKIQDTTIHHPHIDFLERKQLADTLEKTCPMCGRLYSGLKTFDEFQEHVEAHFIDETELDISLDKNLEFISQTVGDF